MSQTGQTDRQRSDSIGRTVLQTVVQKRKSVFTPVTWHSRKDKAGYPPRLLVATITGQLADTPTRGLPTRGLDKSRTGQLAVSQMPPNRKTKHAKSPVASASCPVTT